MKKFYQAEWHGIKFEDFGRLDSDKLADEDFYSKFYTAFFGMYNSFEEIDVRWRHNKEVDANFIISQIQERERVLSIGCGLGYVESLISNKWGGEIIAIEPAKSGVSRWIENDQKIKFKNGYFPECMSGEQVSYAYANAIDYVFNTNEFDSFLKSVYEYGINDFLIISASLNVDSISSNFRYYAKKFLSSFRLIKLGQFWGYQRSAAEYREAILKAGYKDFEEGFLDNGQYWIKGKSG